MRKDGHASQASNRLLSKKPTVKGLKSMIAQLPETAQLPTIVPAFVHIVTLINRRTGHEVGLEITTLSDRFADVMREICHQKVTHKLLGYEVFEVLDCNQPF